MVMSSYQETRPKCKIETFFRSVKQKIIDCYNVDGYCDHCKTVFEAMDVTTTSVLVKKLVPP